MTQCLPQAVDHFTDITDNQKVFVQHTSIFTYYVQSSPLN